MNQSGIIALLSACSNNLVFDLARGEESFAMLCAEFIYDKSNKQTNKRTNNISKQSDKKSFLDRRMTYVNEEKFAVHGTNGGKKVEERQI